MQFFEDGVSCGSPFKGLTIFVVRSNEVVDTLNELFDAGERAAADSFVSNQGEEALNLIQPRAVCRDEVHVPTRACCQPRLDLRMTVSGVVVNDAMDVEICRH